MGVKIINIAVLLVGGAMLADVLSHGAATEGILNSIGSLWNSSLSTVANEG